MTTDAAAARELTPAERLHKHLLTHLDADYAAFVLSEIVKFCRENKPRKKGDPIPSMWDDDIARAQAQIEDHHTGGKRLKNYKGFSESLRTLEILRDRSRQSGAPADDGRLHLIQLLNDLYPPGIARKSRNKAFQETVKIACSVAGRSVPNDNPSTEHYGTDEMVKDALGCGGGGNTRRSDK